MSRATSSTKKYKPSSILYIIYSLYKIYCFYKIYSFYNIYCFYSLYLIYIPTIKAP